MNETAPFQPDDLAELDTRLLSEAHAVVSLREVYAGNRHHDVIGVRHDIDNHAHALPTAVCLAAWEAERGYRSTYFVLHTAAYWDAPEFRAALEGIALRGHEIGIHTNAIAEALRTGEDPDAILERSLARLRGWGHTVRGTVGHGDPLCHEVEFGNDEQFTDSVRRTIGEPDRTLEYDGREVALAPRPLADFGLDYEAIALGRALYNTDSSGRWFRPFDETVEAFTDKTRREGQLHLNLHPDWWGEAFQLAAVSA